MLSSTIQTHPLRAEIAATLAAQVGATLSVDPEPDGIRSPWRTYRYALETTPEYATHRLILQDDITICRDFLPSAVAAIAAYPDRLLSFFVAGAPRDHALAVLRACERGLSWAELDYRRWTPAIALCWPVEMIEPFLTYVDEQNWPEAFRADDEIIGRFMRHTQQRPLATVPSLVQHPDEVPSLIGRRARGGHDPARVAACWIHPDCDPLSIDWTVGPA